MIEEYLENRLSFHGREPVPDENGIRHYFLGLKTEEPERAAKQLGIQGKEGVVKAIHYKNVDHQELMDKGVLNADYAVPRLEEKPRVVAIHLTHSLALKHFLKTNDAKWAFIFEEDVKLPKGGKKARDYVVKYLKDAEEAIPMEEPQLHYIGHCYTGKGGKRVKGDVIKKSSNDDRPRCRHAYVVNKAGAEKLLRSSWPMNNNGDEMWASLDFVYFSDNDGYFIQDWQPGQKTAMRKSPKPIEKFMVENKVVQRFGDGDKEAPLALVILLISFVLSLFPLAFISYRNRGFYGKFTWAGFVLAGVTMAIVTPTLILNFNP